MKKCYKCKKTKEFIEFYTNKSKKDGYSTECTLCKKEQDRKYYSDNKEKIKESVKKYALENKEKVKLNKKEYRIKNKHKIIEYEHKRGKLKNRKESIKNSLRIRLSRDPAARAILNVRNRVNTFLSRYSEKYSKTLGCSKKFFTEYLESKFQEGMSWDNYGKWHIDHIYPLSLAYKEGPEVFKKACHYTNLQPLWAIDNIKKGNRYEFFSQL